jgi:hypothetical protein
VASRPLHLIDLGSDTSHTPSSRPSSTAVRTMFRDPTRTPRSAGEFERAKLEAGRRMGPPRAAEKGACVVCKCEGGGLIVGLGFEIDIYARDVGWAWG